MRVSELLVEGKRKKDLVYETELVKGEINKVIVKIEGKQSESFTKTAKAYKEVQAEVEKYTKILEEHKTVLRGKMEELFDPADDVLTRVVETCSLTLQLAKAVQPSRTETEVVDYKAAFESLVKQINEMVPDLKAQIVMLSECAVKSSTSTEVKTTNGKKSAFTVKEGFAADFMSIVKAVRLKVAKWLNKYDTKLNKVKAEMDKLQAMQARIDRKVKASSGKMSAA